MPLKIPAGFKFPPPLKISLHEPIPSPQIDPQVVSKAIGAGPHFIGSLSYEEIPHPRKEGMTRSVCLLQVDANSEMISKEDLAQLEYRVERDPASVARRLETEWRAALNHQGGQENNSYFDKVREKLLAKIGPPELWAAAAYDVNADIDSEWEGSRKTSIQSDLLQEGTLGASAAAQGLRDAMEDAIMAETFTFDYANRKYTAHLNGLFDGHNGAPCATLLAENFTNYLQTRLERHNSEELSVMEMWNVLKLTFVDFSRSFIGASGSCANVTLEVEGVGLFCANVGDSRAFLMTRDGTAIQLTEDQTLPQPVQQWGEEELEEEEVGPSKYERGNLHRKIFVIMGRVCTLNVPRTVGYKEFSNPEVQLLSSRPKITMPTKERIKEALGRSLEAGEELFLVQGCDGPFRVGSTGQYARFIATLLNRGYSLSEIMATCIDIAYKSGCEDNMTMSMRPILFT